MIDGETETLRGRDVLVRAGRLSRQPQHAVAVLQEALRGRVEDVVSEVVECRRAGGVEDRQRDPLADHRDVAGFEYRPGGRFQLAEVGGHGARVATYVLASSEKIGAASPYQVIPLGRASAIITDAPPQSVTVQELRACQVEVITANASP